MKRGQSGINALVAIDKPSGMSSHAVCSFVRRVVSDKRVGHAGTLDPLAEGVLIVGIGQATRLLGMLTLENKSYLARIRFGEERSTDDAQGELIAAKPCPPELSDKAYAQSVLNRFKGEQMQVPPRYSAISVDGKRSYARARQGEDFELQARPVTVYEANLLALEDDPCTWVCDFCVSKGTYIRSLARDLGRACNSFAYLEALKRSSSGSVSLSCAHTLDRFEEAFANKTLRWLDPSELLSFPVRHLSADELLCVQAGRPLEALIQLEEGECVSLVHKDRLFGVWQMGDSRLKSIATFPDGIEGVAS